MDDLVKEKVRAAIHSVRIKVGIQKPITQNTIVKYQKIVSLMPEVPLLSALSGKPLSKNYVCVLKAAMLFQSRTLCDIAEASDDPHEILRLLRKADKIADTWARPYSEFNIKTRELGGAKELVGLKAKLLKLERKQPGWRKTLDEHYLGVRKNVTRYLGAYLVQRVTGCRSEELVIGVTIEKDRDGFLLYVKTAKQKLQDALPGDDRTRIIRSSNPILESLVGQTVRIDSAQAYQSHFRQTCQRKLGVDLTPYSLRYAVAADLVAAGVPLENLAEYLGHENDKTAGRYARALSRNTGAREKPAICEKARVKVQPTPRTAEARQEARNIQVMSE